MQSKRFYYKSSLNYVDPFRNSTLRPVKVDQLSGIELFIHDIMKSSHYMHPRSQQQQPIVDAMNAVLLSESQPVNQQQQHISSSYHQPNMQSQTSWSNSPQWSNAQGDKPGLQNQMHLGSPSSIVPLHHNASHQGSYRPSPTNNFSSPIYNYSGSTHGLNRPSPYQIPSHHMKNAPVGTMQQHHNQQQSQYQQVTNLQISAATPLTLF